MKNKILLGVIALLLFAGGCTKKNDDVVKIGAILPLTGDGAKYGEEGKRGIELALYEINDPKIKVIFEDDFGKDDGAINAFNKLVNVDKVPIIIGPMYSSTAKAIAPLGEKKKVIIFSPSASSPDLTNAGDYFFRNWPSDEYEGSEMAKFAYDKLNLRTIAILSVNLDYGVGLTKVFQKTFEQSGGKIIITEFYNKSANDFKPQLIKLKALNFDALYLPGYYSEIGLILRQAKEIGLKIKFISCVGFDNPEVLKIAGDAAEDVIFARPFYNPDSQDSIIKDFVYKFKSRFGVLPGTYAAHAYDAMKIIYSVISKKEIDTQEIIHEIYSIKNFVGVTGNTSFDSNGDVAKPIQLMKVRNNEFIKFDFDK